MDVHTSIANDTCAIYLSTALRTHREAISQEFEWRLSNIQASLINLFTSGIYGAERPKYIQRPSADPCASSLPADGQTDTKQRNERKQQHYIDYYTRTKENRCMYVRMRACMYAKCQRCWRTKTGGACIVCMCRKENVEAEMVCRIMGGICGPMRWDGDLSRVRSKTSGRTGDFMCGLSPRTWRTASPSRWRRYSASPSSSCNP
jgi:hypothetical protein